MIISSATVKIMKSIYGTFTKTQFVGAMTNYTPRNKGSGLCPMCLCITKAKLAIKQNDK